MSTTSNPSTSRSAELQVRRRERSKALWAMTPAQRQQAMWAGELTQDQLYEWASRKPKEVPLIDGEFAFIAALTPEVAELAERSR
jgi:hypothetical protein